MPSWEVSWIKRFRFGGDYLFARHIPSHNNATICAALPPMLEHFPPAIAAAKSRHTARQLRHTVFCLAVLVHDQPLSTVCNKGRRAAQHAAAQPASFFSPPVTDFDMPGRTVVLGLNAWDVSILRCRGLFLLGFGPGIVSGTRRFPATSTHRECFRRRGSYCIGDCAFSRGLYYT